MILRRNPEDGPGRDISGSSLVFSAGLFALAAQSILFRDFLAVFEGSEPAIGAFFGLWLLWVAVGATCGRTVARWIFRTRYFELLCLLYLPAFLLGRQLLLDARAICGVEAWEAMTPAQLVLVSIAALGPVSFLTGLIFTGACGWKRRRSGSRVSQVYMLEAAGSFAGGCGVTLGLWARLDPETIFLFAAAAVSAAAAAVARTEKRLPVGAVLLAAILLVFSFGIDRNWAEARRSSEWQSLLGRGRVEGYFSTSRGEYIYGWTDGHFTVLSRTATVETIPDFPGSAPVIATALAQNPSARRILVAGVSSYPLCRRLLEFPQIERVTWIGADPEYPPGLAGVLPESLVARDPRLEIPGADARAFAGPGRKKYDLVILDFPDPATLHLNRYYTLEFFRFLKKSVDENGVVCVSITGGENYMTPAAADMGGSIYLAIENVFGNVAIMPGEQTWLFASVAGSLSESSTQLAGRFYRLENAENVFPRGGFAGLFDTKRIERQRKAYLSSVEDNRVSANTDSDPRALSHAIRLAARRSGLGGLDTAVELLSRRGLPIAAAGLGIFFLLRLLFRLVEGGSRHANIPPVSFMESSLLVATAGASGIGLNVVLMCKLENAGNSIFLLIGLVSSLSMLGMAAGAAIAGRFFSRVDRPSVAAASWMTIHAVLLASVSLPESQPPLVLLCGLFFLGGFMAAGYVPLVASAMEAGGGSPESAGGRIETADHLGGAAGAAAVGLLLIPVLGIERTLLVLAVLVVTNLVIFIPRLPGDRVLKFRFSLRAAGWAMPGLAVFLLVSAHLVSGAKTVERKAVESPLRIFEEVVSQGESREKAGSWNGNDFNYLAVSNCPLLSQTGGEGWFFATREISPDVWGFRDRIVLGLLVDRDGRLVRCSVLDSREDEVYFKPVRRWITRTLEGCNVFDIRALQGIDTLSGATVSSEAVLATVETAGRRFAGAVGMKIRDAETRPSRGFADYIPPLVLLVFLAAVPAVRMFPSRVARFVFLAASVVFLGILFNVQFSVSQVFSLCSLDFPPRVLTADFLLVAVVPLLVIFTGNIYCGWVCPFGALQELAGELRGRKIELEPPRAVTAVARFARYAILFVLVCFFALTFDRQPAAADPLVTIFGFGTWFAMTAVFAGTVMVLSFFYRRFWCRYFCPAGAFLSVLGYLRSRFFSCRKLRPARCDLGVTGRDGTNCIKCDRCRLSETRRPEPGGALKGILFASMFFIAVVVAGWNAAGQISPGGFEKPRQPEDTRKHESFDEARIRRLIREGKISGREAMYYRSEDESE